MLTIKDIRKKSGLTLDQLAEKTGISKRSICMYEANETDVPYMRLKKIAEVLNVNIFDFDPDLSIEQPNQDRFNISLYEMKKNQREDSSIEDLIFYFDRYIKLFELDKNKKDNNSLSFEYLLKSILSLEKRISTLEEVFKSDEGKTSKS